MNRLGPEHLAHYAKIALAVQDLYGVALGFIKLSIICILRRIFRTTGRVFWLYEYLLHAFMVPPLGPEMPKAGCSRSVLLGLHHAGTLRDLGAPPPCGEQARAIRAGTSTTYKHRRRRGLASDVGRRHAKCLLVRGPPLGCPMTGLGLAHLCCALAGFAGLFLVGCGQGKFILTPCQAPMRGMASI
jgi:hypothetical protein